MQADETLQYTVEPGHLTVTFQIGGRINGLDIDKFAFGRADLLFTVQALDAEEAGLEEEISTEPVPASLPMARGKTKFLGSVFSAAQKERFAEFWKQVTPENEGKWCSVERKRDIMNWTELDEAYAFALEHQFDFRYYVLIWGNQQPA